MTARETPWQDIAEAKRKAISDSIPKEWRLASVPSIEEQRDVTESSVKTHLSRREIQITETDASGIVQKTTNGEWKVVEVTKAFCHRAALAQQLVNCLHEMFFDAAVSDATRLDEYYASNKKPIGPLHGLPISLKDQFHVKGVETSMAYVGWIGTFEGKKGTGQEKLFESELVKELRALGAVLYCKTSVPQSLMFGETVNNIIGTTTNPKNRELSSGGSSGGEGALMGLYGSPLGFGTDIGGSIRIPASFNGLYGIRPSFGRLPYDGMANSIDGQTSVLSVNGPISHSPVSLKLAFKALLSQQPWLRDPLCLELPWRDEQAAKVSEQFAFGVLKFDGTVTPHPPVRRAIDTVVKALEQQGHQIFEWRPPAHSRGTSLCGKAYVYDGGHDIHKNLRLSGEPALPQIVGSYGKDEPNKQADATAIAANNVAKRSFQKEYLDYWNSTSTQSGTGQPADAFIMPIAPFAAARHGRYRYYGYTTIINTLDYTACAIPVTNIDKNIDRIDENFQPLSDLDKQVHEDYDPEIYDGAHVGVQLVGRRFQEEKVLALTELIGNALKTSEDGEQAKL
ncbi:uncharacterized protein KY384_002667 [Bacidia gigantensis]|uniref:uncharacterized protein n=1 Tax=Bacidia gigantensis TaxID=2732470 RepID=UPI001D048291|nr:uncharacterized protein KY384_002667 [Bacidia gigantensis]KAG8532789.1 hypothetical protein KY384_002667 [Bacidia gigantensis]